MSISWFGHYFGPEHDSAEAKVFEHLLLFTKAMPEYLFDDESTSKPRKIIVNDNTTFLTIGKTEDTIQQVLDFYDKQYKPHFPGLNYEKLLRKTHKEDVIILNSIFKNYLESVYPPKHYRLQRDNYGFWCTFEFHDHYLNLESEKTFEKIKNNLQDGKLGKLGTGRIVIALKYAEIEKTTIINIWTDRDFNINNLKPNAFGDMSGKDIEGVPRYPGNRRMLTVEQENTRTMDRVVVYEGMGSKSSNILFYHSRMKDEGWNTDQIFEQVMRQQSREDLLFYTRSGRECTIQISEDESTGKIITIVIDRTTI